MSVDQKIFVDGHIGKVLLREFAKDSDGFDDNIVEEIWQHLDNCEVCIAEYESVREDYQPDEQASAAEAPPDPASGGGGALEPDLVDPEDLESAKVGDSEKNKADLNGVTPVGDDPTRNGVPNEYRNGDRPTTVSVKKESPTDAAKEETSEVKEVAEDAGEPKDADEPKDAEGKQDDEGDSDDDKSDDKRPRIKVPQIEGLITGEVHELEVKPDKLQTESAVDANERISTDDPEITAATDEDEEPPQDAETDGDKADTEIDISPPTSTPTMKTRIRSSIRLSKTNRHRDPQAQNPPPTGRPRLQRRNRNRSRTRSTAG